LFKFAAWLICQNSIVTMGFFKTPPLMGHKESLLPLIANANQKNQVLTGPAIMIMAAAYQLIKKQQTGTHKGELLNHIWKFLSKAEARDKVGRLVQYGCRCLQGVLAHQTKDSWLNANKPVIVEIQTTLAWARRTNRWGKELPHIPALGEALSRGDWLEATQRTILITFLVQDHIYWLLKMGILKFQQYSAIEWHRRNLRLITISHVFNFALCVRDITRIRKKQENGDPSVSGSVQALETADKKVQENKMMMVRYVLTFIQMIHVSGVRQFDDWYIGFFGMISSAIDASKQW